jgi:hypothetical protein
MRVHQSPDLDVVALDDAHLRGDSVEMRTVF